MRPLTGIRARQPLKMAALALILAALWNPGWTRNVTPAPLVLLDVSASMSLLQRVDPEAELQRWLRANPQLEGVPVVRFAAHPIAAAPANAAPHQITTAVDRSATDIEQALRQGLHDATADTALLLISDGIETAGDAAPLLRTIREAGRGVYHWRPEAPTDEPAAWIQTVQVPSSAAPDQPFTAVVELVSTARQPALLQTFARGELRTEQVIALTPGQNLHRLPLATDGSGALDLRITLQISPFEGEVNHHWQGVVNVFGKARVLYVTSERPQPSLLASLTRGGWPVAVIHPSQLRQSLQSDLAVVVLDNVAIADAPAPAWSDLVDVVTTRGVGLLALGGDRSFGAGGYRHSTLESLLPVTAEAGVPLAPAAVMFVLDHSGSMDQSASAHGDGGRSRWAQTAEATIRATTMLGGDYVGIVGFDRNADLLMPLDRHEPLEAAVLNALQRVRPSGGTLVSSGLQLALDQFDSVAATERLLILVSDGLAAAESLAAPLERIDQLGVEVIALLVGDNQELNVIRELTQRNNGRLVVLNAATELPTLMTEAVGSRRLSLATAATAVAQISPLPYLHDVDWPPLSGYAVTRARPTAIVYLRSERGDPLLAAQSVGLGRVVALPAGLGSFAADWPQWPKWSAFAGGLVEWTAAARSSERVRLRLQPQDRQLQLELDLADPSGDWVAGATPSAQLAQSGAPLLPVALTATAPGRYEGSLPVMREGRHRLAIEIGDQRLQHEFFHHVPGELSERTSQFDSWMQADMIRPWPEGGLASAPVKVSLQPHLIGAALLFYVLIFLKLPTWKAT